MMGLLVSSFLMIFVVFTFVLYIYILIDIIKHEFTGYNKIAIRRTGLGGSSFLLLSAGVL